MPKCDFNNVVLHTETHSFCRVLGESPEAVCFHKISTVENYLIGEKKTGEN